MILDVDNSHNATALKQLDQRKRYEKWIDVLKTTVKISVVAPN